MLGSNGKRRDRGAYSLMLLRVGSHQADGSGGLLPKRSDDGRQIARSYSDELSSRKAAGCRRRRCADPLRRIGIETRRLGD